MTVSASAGRPGTGVTGPAWAAGAAMAASAIAAPVPKSRLMVRQPPRRPTHQQGTQVPCTRRADARGSAPTGPARPRSAYVASCPSLPPVRLRAHGTPARPGHRSSGHDRRRGAARAAGARAGGGRASRRDRDALPRRQAHDAERRPVEHRATRRPDGDAAHADREHREGVQRRGRAAPRRGGQAGSGRHDRPAASRPADGVGGRDRPPDAQPHERPPGLHPVRRASRSRRRRTRRATSRPPRSSTGCAGRRWSSRRARSTSTPTPTTSSSASSPRRSAGTPYPALLKDIVFGPANLTQTSFPTRRISLPAPYIHGYLVDPNADPQRRHALPQPERRVGVGRGRLDPHRPLRVHPRRPRA